MALLEINPIAASPFNFVLSLIRNKKNAAKITTGTAITNGAIFITIATDKAPKPTWDNPSPIIE